MIKSSGVFFAAFLCSAVSVYGQADLADSAFLVNASKNAHRVYVDAIGDQANLYNGVQYLDYISVAETQGQPYFKIDDFVDGDVYYDSGLYSNVPMLYDLVKDRLVIDQPFSHFKMELIGEKVKYFNLSGHTFVRLVQVKNDSSLSTGFYDRLYNGKVKVYLKHRKERKETAQATGVKVEYLDKNQLYIFKDSRYYKVKSKKSVLNVFRDRKKTLRKEISRNKIIFRLNRDQAVAMIAKLYDETEKK